MTIGFLNPAWLWLLGLIPLIRWLHRFRQRSVIFPTTTLFLWRSTRPHPDSDGLPGRPDRRWLLRGLIATLLILSLARPVLQTERAPTIEVWLDDSLSMYTREEGRQRMQRAMERLIRYLVDADPDGILLHSLGNSAASLSLEPHAASQWPRQLAEWTAKPRGEPDNPPANLPPRHEHILVTDGADATLNDWAGSAPLRQVIRVGKASRNIALTRLSLRLPMHESEPVSGIAGVDNTGEAPRQARLILQQGGRILDSRPLEIPPLKQITVSFTLPLRTAASSLQARLESADDPLSLDNSLQLETGKLSPALHYRMNGDCGGFLQTVLEAYPFFIADAAQPQLVIDCTGLGADSAQATLRLPPSLSPRRTQGPAHWHTSAPFDALQLAAGLPYGDKAPPLSADTIPILSADDRQLIRWAVGSNRVIESYLDIRDETFARQAEYPLLIIGLIERLTGLSPDMAPLSATREIAASRIKPLALTLSPATPARTPQGEKPLTPHLLAFCLLLLLWDAALAIGLYPREGRGGG